MYIYDILLNYYWFQKLMCKYRKSKHTLCQIYGKILQFNEIITRIVAEPER
jgi:hypothetical protein